MWLRVNEKDQQLSDFKGCSLLKCEQQLRNGLTFSRDKLLPGAHQPFGSADAQLAAESALDFEYEKHNLRAPRADAEVGRQGF